MDLTKLKTLGLAWFPPFWASAPRLELQPWTHQHRLTAANNTKKLGFSKVGVPKTIGLLKLSNEWDDLGVTPISGTHQNGCDFMGTLTMKRSICPWSHPSHLGSGSDARVKGQHLGDEIFGPWRFWHRTRIKFIDTLWWTNIVIENGHRNSRFSHEKWWIFPWQNVSSPEGNPGPMIIIN